MNILIFSQKFAYSGSPVGGAETSMALLAETLATRGINVTYLTSEYIHNSNKTYPYEVISLQSFKSFKWRKVLHRVFRLIGYKAFQKKNLESRLIKEVLLEKKINLVYLFYETHFLNLFIDIKNHYKFSIVLRMAGLGWWEECKEDPKTLDLYKKVFCEVDSINYLTPGLRDLCYEKAAQLNLEIPQKFDFIADIGGCANPATARITARDIEEPRKEIRLLMVSRFSDYQKRQDILVSAAEILKGKIPFKLKFVGSGIKKASIEQLVSEKYLESYISFQSFISQDALWSEMRKADLLCHACDYEGVSKIIIESMAIGLPVLASKVKPLEDYISSGETGFLVDNKPDQWASAIVNMYNNMESLKNISENARRFVDNQFNPSKNVETYESAFREITSKQNI